MKIVVYVVFVIIVVLVLVYVGGYVVLVVEVLVVVVFMFVIVDVSDWMGFYVGLQYGKGNVELNYVVDEDFDLYGLYGGYLCDFGKFVVGGELFYDKIDFDNSGDVDLWCLCVCVGYDMGCFLFYVMLGVVYVSGDNDLLEIGVIYGVGVDFKLIDKFIVGVEYLCVDFKDVFDVDNVDIDIDLVQICVFYCF